MNVTNANINEECAKILTEFSFTDHPHYVRDTKGATVDTFAQAVQS